MKELMFDPFPFISGKHEQTILSTVFRSPFQIGSTRKIVTLNDGDKLSLEVSTPQNWKKGDLTVFMLHGLCGSHKSCYLVRLTKRLNALGIQSIRMNGRGCGSGVGLAKKIYHAGQSYDVFEAVKAIDCSPLLLLGYSMGGNIALKLAGELGSLAANYFAKVIAVSPPVDLFNSAQFIKKDENHLYELYFIRLLKRDANIRWRLFPEIPRFNLSATTFADFDEIYTAPMGGFKNALDYYEKSSSKNVISNISVPTQILVSQDDPVIDYSQFADMPGNVDIFCTRQGGHLGYLAKPGKGRSVHWMDDILLNWILEK